MIHLAWGQHRSIGWNVRPNKKEGGSSIGAFVTLLLTLGTTWLVVSMWQLSNQEPPWLALHGDLYPQMCSQNKPCLSCIVLRCPFIATRKETKTAWMFCFFWSLFLVLKTTCSRKDTIIRRVTSWLSSS